MKVSVSVALEYEQVAAVDAQLDGESRSAWVARAVEKALGGSTAPVGGGRPVTGSPAPSRPSWPGVTTARELVKDGDYEREPFHD